MKNLSTFVRNYITKEDCEIAHICSHWHPRNVKKQESLVQQGALCREFYFVTKGCIRVFFMTDKGIEKTNHIALEHTIISAMSSFISQEPSFEMIDALEDTEFLAIGHEDFYKLIDTCRPWELFYRFMLETAYITKVKRMEARLTLSAKDRFALVLQENPAFTQRVPNRILASYIDVTQETLSRLKSHTGR